MLAPRPGSTRIAETHLVGLGDEVAFTPRGGVFYGYTLVAATEMNNTQA